MQQKDHCLISHASHISVAKTPFGAYLARYTAFLGQANSIMSSAGNVWPWYFTWDNKALGANMLMAQLNPSLNTASYVESHFQSDVLGHYQQQGGSTPGEWKTHGHQLYVMYLACCHMHLPIAYKALRGGHMASPGTPEGHLDEERNNMVDKEDEEYVLHDKANMLYDSGCSSCCS